MNLKQLKLTNNEEIICEVLEQNDDHGDLIVRKILRVVTQDDFDQNIRYYSFRPWVSFQDDIEELSVLNTGHIITETAPSNILISHWNGAWKEIAETNIAKRELNLDQILAENPDFDEDDIHELILEKIAEAETENEEMRLGQFSADSSATNVIHFKPTDTKH